MDTIVQYRDDSASLYNTGFVGQSGLDLSVMEDYNPKQPKYINTYQISTCKPSYLSGIYNMTALLWQNASFYLLFLCKSILRYLLKQDL